jgi:hypothetical protein
MTKAEADAMRSELEALEAEQAALPASERDPVKIERAHVLFNALRKGSRAPTAPSDDFEAPEVITLVVKLPKGLHERYKRVCKARCVTMAGQLRMLIETYTERKPE